jgi:glycosyltransferase involved in cell wall biosynthesis
MLQYSHVLDGVICTNKLGCVLAKEAGGMEASRIHYAPYGVSIPEVRSKDAENKTLKIIYVGRLGENFQKRVFDIPGILDLLDRANIDYALKIVGSGEEEIGLREKLRAQISHNKVSFTGALFGETLANFYNWADVMLITSFWETGPIVAWEAMARGAVLVSSAYVGSRLEGSLKDEENCLLFPIGDIDKAADCLIKAQDAKLREKLSENGYRLVLEKYTREVSVSLWDKAFRDILSAPLPVMPERLNRASKISNSGRLDRIFGVSVAENIREVLGLRFEHKDAGGEWPHSYGQKKYDDKEFWDLAKRLDRGIGL